MFVSQDLQRMGPRFQRAGPIEETGEAAWKSGEKKSLVLVVHDRTTECECLANALAANCPEFRVVAHPFSTIDSLTLQPDLVVVAFGSADPEGDTFSRFIGPIRSALGDVPYVALMEDDETNDASARLFRLGASGCMSYSAGLEGLTKMLWLVLHGGMCFPRASILERQEDLGEAHAPCSEGGTDIEGATGPGRDAPEAGLTQREVDVVRKLRLGKPNKIIAYELGISISTVKVHLRNIMRKTGATNRVEAALLSTMKGAHLDGSRSLQL